MLYYKYLFVTKCLLISISLAYIVTTIWTTPNKLSLIKDNEKEYVYSETNWYKVRTFYILSIIFSDMISLLGIFAAFTQQYTISMVSSIIKVLTLIISFALLIRPPLICLLLNILMSLFSLLFSFLLWIKREWLIEAKISLSQQFDV